MNVFYDRLMQQAFREAEKAYAAGEVPVGAVVADAEGLVHGKGYNQVEMLSDATAHAEMIALTAAMASLGTKYLQDCTLVVTMEPCPMCAGAIVNAKVGRVVFGAYDAKMGACGTVFNLTNSNLLNHKSEVIGGIWEDKSVSFLKQFFEARRKKPISNI